MTALNLTLIVVAIMISLWLLQVVRLRKYSSRSCQGKAWKAAFPDATKQEIRDFLQAFVDSFVFPQKLKLRLRPGDHPKEIYEIISMGVDSYEYEEFTVALQNRFGRGLSDSMDESWTLGDIFNYARGKK